MLLTHIHAGTLGGITLAVFGAAMRHEFAGATQAAVSESRGS